MSDEAKPKKPRRGQTEIVPLPPPPPEIRLGSLAIADPKEMIRRAAELASALAEIIHAQKDAEGKPTLYVMIQGRKYVRAEGWTTLGAMMGVVPMEEFCDPLPEGGGYKAKVKLVRLNDGQQVGAASAICKLNEPGWNKDAAATHSKAITRATGKAFRLSFAWIMKLAGFEPTPADELFEAEGSEEQAQEVATEKLAQAEAKKQDRKIAKTCVFMTWPESHNGHNFFLTNRVLIMENGLHQELLSRNGRFNERDGGYYVSAEHADDVRFLFTEKLGPERFIERKFNGDNSGGAGPAPVS
jgi:hypothetical protein